MTHVTLLLSAILGCSVCSASWPWVGSNKAISRSTPARRYVDPNNFNPTELLDPEVPKPEIWEKALAELQGLKNKPSCNRLAAIMLMNDCRLLERHNDRNLPSDAEHDILDHINSYAASLAICDLEAARAPIPKSCEPFRDTAMLAAAGRGGCGVQHISRDQIGLCMNGLVSDQSSWISWNSNRDRAMIICRASRIDIERDKTLSLYEDTSRILSTLVEEFKIELRQRERVLADQDATMQSHFNTVLASFGSVNDGISIAISSVAKQFQSIIGILTTASDKAEDVEKVFDRLQTSILKSNAEHVSVQEQVLAVTNGLALGTKNARTEVGSVLQLLADVSSNMNSIGMRISSIQQRQDAMDVQSARALVTMKNLTEQLQLATSLADDHIVNMEQATQAALSLVDLAKEAAISFSSAPSSLLTPDGPFGVNWLLLVLAPLMAVTLGGYGLPASVRRNLTLMGSGLVIAKLLTLACDVQWHSKLPNTSAFMQLVQQQPLLSTVITDPISSIIEERETTSYSK